ncbi:hypothetical protein ACJZ2D_008053 [Fusarium nematophilum]
MAQNSMPPTTENVEDGMREKEAFPEPKASNGGSESGESEQLFPQQGSALQLGKALTSGKGRLFWSALNVSSVASTRTTGSGYHEHVIEVAEIPDIPIGGKEVECPYCFTILFENELRGPRWKSV